MNERYFVLSDIHGCYKQMVELLTHWNKEQEQLIILGDLIDRGEDSLACVRLAKALHEIYGAIVLKGNHEDMFLKWLATPENTDHYFRNGGEETIANFVKEDLTFEERAKKIHENLAGEVAFLKSRPLSYEVEKYIFVHAGINVEHEDWKDTSESDFLWIREPFHVGENKTGKVILFGHTSTRSMREGEDSDDVWFSSCNTKLGIDGGAVYGGQLNGVKIDGETYTFFSA